MAHPVSNALALALGMPKAELHVHIEGTLEPGLAFALALRNGIAFPYESEAALAAAYHFDSLQSFLDLYYACAQVLCKPEDFRDLMLAYLEKAAADGVIVAEVFFDPQTHTARGIPMGDVIHGLLAGADEARTRWGVESKLILCFLRHLSEEDGMATLDAAAPYLQHIAGFGLDSSEQGRPPALFERLFARCRALGKPVVAHAGEEGPPAYVWEALDLLKVQRVDHGVRSLEDPALIDRLVAEKIPLTVCPLSNIRLCVYPEMAAHPMRRLLDAGVKITVNSDDPAYFGGYMNDNIRALQEAFAFDADAWYRMARNGFEACFATDAEKAAWIARLDAFWSVKAQPIPCPPSE